MKDSPPSPVRLTNQVVMVGIFEAAMIFLATVTRHGLHAFIVGLIVAVAVVSAVYLIVTFIPFRVIVRDATRLWLHRRDRDRYLTFLNYAALKVEGRVRPEWFVVLLHPDHRRLTMGTSPNPMVKWNDLRCVVTTPRYFGKKKSQECGAVIDGGPGTALAKFPIQFLDNSITGPAVGSYKVRWLSANFKKRAQTSLWCDGIQLLPHPFLRAMRRMSKYFEHLRGLDEIEELLLG